MGTRVLDAIACSTKPLGSSSGDRHHNRFLDSAKCQRGWVPFKFGAVGAGHAGSLETLVVSRQPKSAFAAVMQMKWCVPRGGETGARFPLSN